MEMKVIRTSENIAYDAREDAFAAENSKGKTPSRRWKIVAAVAFIIATGLLAAVVFLAVKSSVQVPPTASGRQEPTPTAGEYPTSGPETSGPKVPVSSTVGTTASSKVPTSAADSHTTTESPGTVTATTHRTEPSTTSLPGSTTHRTEPSTTSVPESTRSTAHIQATTEFLLAATTPPPIRNVTADGQFFNVSIVPLVMTSMKSRLEQTVSMMIEIQVRSRSELDMAVYGRRFSLPTHTRYDFTRPLVSSQRRRGELQTFQISEVLTSGLWYFSLFNGGQSTVEVVLRFVTSSPPLSCPGDCSGNGVCFNGTCVCLPPWNEADCSKFGCSLSGCGNNGKCENGACVCDEGWKGADCSKIDCIPADCSGHGQCVDGTCDCDGKWRGDGCEIERKSCLYNCSNRGFCNDDLGLCICDAMFTGAGCSVALCVDDCNGRGNCVNGSCSCHPQWSGLACDILACAVECDLHGVCNNGTCICDKGWKGKNCRIDACPSNCHQNGSCTKNDEGEWHCACLPGFRGDSCNIGIESVCDDGLDNDADFLTDCTDPDCCNSSACINDVACVAVQDPVELVANETFNASVSFYETIRFLFDFGLQWNVDVSQIDEARVGVVKGRVTTRDTTPLRGVTVAILNEPAYGQTLTRSDGSYDIAVNGGGSLTVTFNKNDFIGSQRSIAVPVNDYVRADDVALIPLDSKATEIDLESGDDDVKVAAGSRVEDESGSRQGVLMFPPNTQATIVSKNETADNMTVAKPVIRVTEYTVGSGGRDAMPAELPPYSGYTYAVEMSLDQASVNGSTEVVFNQTLAYYVENYLGFPVGSAVPIGYYNRTLGEWVASENGRVVMVLNVTTSADGKPIAVLDVSGNGLPATSQELETLGVLEKELLQLGLRYAANQSLWRVPIRHFTPWDCNWPYGPPRDGCSPFQCSPKNPIKNPSPPKDPKDPCQSKGSIIIPQTQTLGEELSIAGTSMSLFYFSDRVLGYRPVLSIPLTAATIPASLKTVHLRVVIRGKTFEEKFSPSPNLQHQFVWDRKDSYGRTVVGQVTAFISIGYEYGLIYYPVSANFRSSFNRLSQASISTPVGRQSESAVFWEKRSSVIGNAFGPVDVAGLGGWSISSHHAYDTASGVLHKGDGKRTQFKDRSQVIETLAGDGTKRLTNCVECLSSSLPATSSLRSPVCIAVGADGSVFIGDYELIRKVHPGGNMTTVVDLSMSPPDFSYYIAISPVDGDLFISYAKTRQIYRVKASLLLPGRSPITLNDIDKVPGATVFAGTGEKCHGWDENCGDDGLAVKARLSTPKGISVGSRSDVYFADGKVIRQVGVDGVISTFAGSRVPRGCSPPGCAMDEIGNDDIELDRAYFDWPTDVVVQRDDESVYFVDGNNVYHVAREGRVRLVAGAAPHVSPEFELKLDDDDGERSNQFAPRRASSIDFNRLQGLAVWRDGSVYFTETDDRRINRVLLLDQDGFVNLITGVDSDCDCRYCPCFAGDDQPAISAKISYPSAVALSPNGGQLYVADQGNVRVRMARISLPSSLTRGHYVIPSDDGRLAFVFDFTGRHVSTALASSGEVIQTFEYEDFDTPQGRQGLLTAIRDAYNNSLLIQRAPDGHALALDSNYGYRTTLELNRDGYLGRIVDPTGAAVRFSYHGFEGLLASTTDPRNMVHTYQYDQFGRLIRDRQPDGGTTLVSKASDSRVDVRSETGRGYSVELENIGSEARQVVTESSGAKTVSKDLRDGSQFVLYEDGSKTVVATASHPIWGAQLQVVANVTSKLPSGLTKEILSKHYGDLARKGDPLSVTRFGHTMSVSGSDLVQVEYVRSTRTRTVKFLKANIEKKSIYNKFDQVVESVTTASGLFPTKTAYNRNGLVSSQSQGNSTREFKYLYDLNGRVVEEVLEGNTVATFLYEQGEEKPRTMRLASGRNYTFTYDYFDELETITMPSGSVHRLISTVALGQTTAAYAAPNQNSSYANVYDAAGDLILERYPSGKRVVRQRMDFGGRIAESSFDNFVVDYSYSDKTDRVSTIHRHRTGQLGIQSDMADDSDQILQPLVAPGTATISFQYDGSLVTRQSVTMASDSDEDLSASFSYAYDSLVRLSSRTLTIEDGKPSTLAYQYDKANRVTRFGDIVVDYSQPGVQWLADSRLQHKTTFDGYGKIKERTMTVRGNSVYSMKLEYGKHLRIRSKSLSFGVGDSTKYEYEYDVDGQLVGVLKDGKTTERYRYDANGNRVSWTVHQASHSATYNDVDQITGFSGNNHYDVDEDGFLTRKRDLSYSYSSQGELTSIVDLPTGQVIGSYVYDGFNRRVVETSAGNVTKYLYGDMSNQHRVTHVVTETNELISLHYDLTGHLIAFDRDAQRYYVAADQVGTPWAVIDSSGTIVKRLSYTTYGVVLSDTNSAVDAVLGFAGGLQDSVATLVHFAFRDYDAETGRWTARDPSLYTANQPNLYQYVFNDPVNFLDPLGLWCIGGSFYAIIGVGAEFCYENGRASICVEKGYGIGWDVGFDAQKKPSRSKVSVFGEAGASKGWLYGSVGGKIGGEYELSKPPPCEGRGSWSVSGGASAGLPTPKGLVGAGVQGSYGNSGGSWSVVGGASGGGKTTPGKIGIGAQGKVGIRGCLGSK